MENISFRVSSFGGFNKDDVMQYIDKMNFQVKEIQEKNDALVKRLQQELADKDAELDQAREDNRELVEKIKETELKNKEIEHENNNLTEMVRLKTSSVDEQVKNLEQEKAELFEKIATLGDQLATASKDRTSYDHVKDALVKLEIDAHIRAKYLKDQAKQEATQLLEIANEQAQEITQKANDEYTTVITEKQRVIAQTKKEVTEIIAESTEKFAKIQEEIASIHIINQNVCTHLNDFSERIAKILDESIGE